MVENQKIIIASNGKETHIMVNGKLYGNHITEVNFSHKTKKRGRDDVKLLLTADAVPIPESNNEEKQVFMKMLEELSKE